MDGVDWIQLKVDDSIRLCSIIILEYCSLLKTELRISDFQHFHWLVGQRVSVHILYLLYLIWSRNLLAIKQGENICAALRKK